MTLPADIQITLPLWYDLHTHIRQEGLMGPVLASQIAMGCCGVLAMPNTRPPVAVVSKRDEGLYWSIESYREALKRAGGDVLEEIIVPLYLTKDTTPQQIEAGARSGLLRACKYYPPHGTTGADFGYPFKNFMENGVFQAMEDHGVVLCIHGEEHHMPPETYFSAHSNAEDAFYKTRMPELIARFPCLKVVCEHVTTATAVAFVAQAGPHVVASVTPQHLLYTIGDLLQGLKYHLFCLPLLKFQEDREALRRAVSAPDNTQFFAGTDSAPHTRKATECGCAAGCFTGGIAPQLYAQGFESAGLDLSQAVAQQAFRAFLCENGRRFYTLPEPAGTFMLTKTPQTLEKLGTPDGDLIPLPLGLGQADIPWRLTL